MSFAQRGFAVRDVRAAAELEGVAGHFVEGYHAALLEPRPAELGRALGRIALAYRGFAFEGAGMALALLDRLTPWRRSRLADFLRGPGDAHAYMVHIGAGWAWARLGSRLEPRLRSLDPVLGWLAVDGFGFHEGFFHTQRTLRGERPPRLRGYALRVFDTGLGRSLWFSCGACPETIAARIAALPAPRHADLFAGVGLACSYAGGVGDETIASLCALAGAHRGALAQGAAFAAKARERAGNPTEHTRRAVERITGTRAELAAKLCDTAFEESSRAPATRTQPRFEQWRREIREAFERGFAAAGGAS